MNGTGELSLTLFLAPLLIFGLVFRRSWTDKDLLHSAMVGLISGVLATIGVKFIAYPMITFFMGIDLRSMLSETNSFMLRILACLGVIGPIEETAKGLGVVVGICLWDLQKRPPAVFIGSIAAGLGFSLVENLDYYELYGLDVLLMRELISSTGHAVFSGIFGLAAARALPLMLVREPGTASRSLLTLLLGLASASILHGFFNLAAFGLSGNTPVPTLAVSLLFGIVFLNVMWTAILVADQPALPIAWECPECDARRIGRDRFCTTCGTRVIPINPEIPQ